VEMVASPLVVQVGVSSVVWMGVVQGEGVYLTLMLV
jgi:hypothetical protein